jgi:hypothetical protein
MAITCDHTRDPSGGGHNSTVLTDTDTDTAPTATLVMEGRVDLIVLPITLGVRAGSMRLADGRLTYTRRRRGRVVFDAPVHEVHSFGRSSLGTGFHLWHGATRYRFVAGPPAAPVGDAPGLVGDVAEGVAQVRQGLAQTARCRAEVDRWHDALVPVIAAGPPLGVTVRRPWSPRRFVATTAALVAGATAVVVGAITAVVAVVG